MYGLLNINLELKLPLRIYGLLNINLALKSDLRSKLRFTEHRFKDESGLKDFYGLKYTDYQTFLYIFNCYDHILPTTASFFESIHGL